MLESHYTLKPLKELLEEFYIDHISTEIDVDNERIKYINSAEILVDDMALPLFKKDVRSMKTLKREAEERLNSFLSTFICKKNQDVEDFIRNDSISFQKRNKTRTYLILSDDDSIIGYFSLGLKPIIIIDDSSLSAKEKNLMNIKELKTSNISVMGTYLIGQIGRDDRFSSDDLNLEMFFTFIFSIIKEVQDKFGGTNILIEVDNQQKLIDLYESYGFKYLQLDETGLSQLLQLSLNY